MNNNQTAKSIFWWLLNVALLIVVLVGLALGGVLRNEVSQARTITVSAEGKVKVVPDVSTITFSVVSEGKDPKALQIENTNKMNAAIAFVKSLGIDAKDIKTDQFSLQPKYQWIQSEGRQITDGYTFTQSVTVTLRDFNKAADVSKGLVSLGINQISGPNFNIEDTDRYQNQARELAFKKARAKVDAMARENGVRVRRVVTFSEGSSGPIYYARAEATSADGSGGAVPPTPVLEPGQQEVRVQVSVTYEIR